MKVELCRDPDNEEVAVRVDGKVIYRCKDYETDHWVAAIVKALGGTYTEIEDAASVYGD